jgi:hypothetical protein
MLGSLGELLPCRLWREIETDALPPSTAATGNL